MAFDGYVVERIRFMRIKDKTVFCAKAADGRLIRGEISCPAMRWCRHFPATIDRSTRAIVHISSFNAAGEGNAGCIV